MLFDVTVVRVDRLPILLDPLSASRIAQQLDQASFQRARKIDAEAAGFPQELGVDRQIRGLSGWSPFAARASILRPRT